MSCLLGKKKEEEGEGGRGEGEGEEGEMQRECFLTLHTSHPPPILYSS